MLLDRRMHIKNRMNRKHTFFLPSSRDESAPCMNAKAKRLLITALVESKLPSVLMPSLITNTILMLKPLELLFLTCYSLYQETVPTPSPISLERIITCVCRWRNCSRSRVRYTQSVSWLGGSFPSPCCRARPLLHTQLVVSSFKVGPNSNKIAEKAKFAYYKWYFNLYHNLQFLWVW